MRAIAKIGASAPTIGSPPLPRDVVGEVSRGLPDVPKEVVRYVYTQLVLPITSMFDGGRAMPDDERVMVCSMYVEALAGYEPEAYPIARSKMVRERNDRFRPMPAEIRTYLEWAENKIWARSGLKANWWAEEQARNRLPADPAFWRDLLSKHARYITWDARYLGFPPGHKKCRIPESVIDELCLAAKYGSGQSNRWRGIAEAKRALDREEYHADLDATRVDHL